MNFHLLTQYLDSLNEEYGIPGLDVIVTKDYETVYRHQTGHADYDGKRPVSDGDFYRLFSATKVMTMTAMMQLIEQGKVSLYDPVSRFLPEWDMMTVVNANWREKGGNGFCPTLSEPSHYAKNRVRIIDCMSMTAGLTYDLNSEAIRELISRKPDANTREVVAAIARMPLLFEPGTRYQYSLGHDVIAAVIEVVSGEKFSDYLQKHLFGPLGVTDLTCHPTKEQWDRMSALYAYDPASKEMKPEEMHAMSFEVTPEYESGGASLCGSVDAYSEVICALANGGVGRNGARILSEEGVMRFTHSVLTDIQLTDFRVDRFLEYSYGLGVRVHVTSTLGRSPVGEYGWDGAAGAYALIDPFNHVSVFYAHHILNFGEVYNVIHPRVRDLVYLGLSR